MGDELRDLLTAYLMEWKTMGDCAEWFASVDWDDPSFDRKSREEFGQLELLVTEFLEGLRPEGDFSKAASKFASKGTNWILPPLWETSRPSTKYFGKAVSSNSRTTRDLDITDLVLGASQV